MAFTASLAVVVLSKTGRNSKAISSKTGVILPRAVVGVVNLATSARPSSRSGLILAAKWENIFIYLYIWLYRVLVLTCRIFSCGMWNLVP